MATDDQYALLYNKKIIPLDQLKTKLVDYMVSQVRTYGADTFSTDASLGASIVPVTAGTANKISVAAASLVNAVTGNGRRIKTVSNGDSRLQNIKIPPNAGVIYSVGIEQNDVENGVETNPRTGAFQYTSYIEAMGRVGNPTSVTVTGGGTTLTINVNSLVESGDDHSGRSFRVWLKTAENGGPGPQSASPTVAIQTIVSTFSAPNNTIVVPNLMGQSVASTTVTDYMVQLVGPTVKRQTTENLQNTAGCFFLAAVTSVAGGGTIVAIDTSAQNILSLSLADVDTHIQNLESNLDVLMRSVAVSGFAQTWSAALSFPVASGVSIISGLRVTSIAQTLALSNNTTNWVYVDSADGITKVSTAAPSISSLLLYKVATSAGTVTSIIDIRRMATRLNSRGFITVGGANSDFTTLDGAITWMDQERQSLGTSEQIAWEIVVQQNITMATQVSFLYPVTIRGAALDGGSVGDGSPRVKITTPNGYAFQNGGLQESVCFRDLYFSIPTGATSGFYTNAVSASGGNNWEFRNCIFDGGKDNPCFQFNQNISPDGWLWEKCQWKNGTHTGQQPYVLVSGSTGAPTGFTFRKCRFSGELTDTFVVGIQFDNNTAECTVEDCEFNTGGFGIFAQGAADQIRIKGNRFKNQRDAAIKWAPTAGECIITDNYFNNCMTNSTNSSGVIALTGLDNNCVIRDNRIKNWQTGCAVFVNSGADQRIENNVMTTTAATPTKAISYANSATGNNSLISGNDIDLSTGASAGSGKASGIAIDTAVATGVRILNNKIKNCGSSATGGNAINAGASQIVAGNILVNGRGIFVSSTAADIIVMGNIVQAGMSTSSEQAVVVFNGANQLILGNVFHGATAAMPYGNPTPNGSWRAFCNATEVVQGLVSGGGSPQGAMVRRRDTFDPANQSYGAGSTTVVHTVVQPTHTIGVHLPANVSLAASVTGNTIQAVLRLSFSDGTTQDIVNATAGVVAVDLLGTPGVLTSVVDDLTINVVAMATKNTSTLVTADIGATTYEGYVVG